MPEQARSSRAVRRWSQPPRREFESSWPSWLPAGFVLFSLLALLVAPRLFNGRVQELREEAVTPAQEARGEVNEILRSFSQAEAAIRGLLLTRDERFLATLRAEQVQEARAFERLLPLAERLDSALYRRVVRLHASAEGARVAHEVLVGQALAGDPPLSLLGAEEERHERLVAEASAVKADVVGRLHAARQEIRRVERAGTLLTALLAALALGSALVVIRIGRNFRRRARQEAELRAAAVALTEPTEVEEVLRRIVAVAARMDPDGSSYVERVDADRREVEIVAGAGPGAPVPGTRIPYPGSLTGEPAASTEPEVVADIAHGERPIAAVLRDSCGDCTALVLPLIADESSRGALVILRPRGRSFRDSEVAAKRVLALLAAMTLRRTELLEEAQRQREALERATQSRERLIRGVSHDVKNPLGAADGNAQLLEMGVLGELTERQQESVRRIRSSLGTALDLIGDLTDLARAEAGQLEIRRTEVDAAAIGRELVRDYGAAAEAAGLTLGCDVPATLPPVPTDPRRVRQILGNLLTNAMKYTPEGGHVRLTGEVRRGRRSDDPERWLTLSVHDDGPGIPEERRTLLFGEFQRLDPQSAPGAGLGLAISQRIAGLLGGEITLESGDGERGSTFTLWLPRKGHRAA